MSNHRDHRDQQRQNRPEQGGGELAALGCGCLPLLFGGGLVWWMARWDRPTWLSWIAMCFGACGCAQLVAHPWAATLLLGSCSHSPHTLGLMLGCSAAAGITVIPPLLVASGFGGWLLGMLGVWR